jgi:Xaa-Pro aminopeptidase
MLEKGMVLSLEPWYGEPLVGGVRLEDTGVITDKGWESFYTLPVDQMLVPRSAMIFEL